MIIIRKQKNFNIYFVLNVKLILMKVKNNIIKQLDSQASSVKATTAGQPGGEGYVLAHPGGDMKLVNRAGFTAANRAVQR